MSESQLKQRLVVWEVREIAGDALLLVQLLRRVKHVEASVKAYLHFQCMKFVQPVHLHFENEMVEPGFPRLD